MHDGTDVNIYVTSNAKKIYLVYIYIHFYLSDLQITRFILTLVQLVY